jgi:hypothetical protein
LDKVFDDALVKLESEFRGKLSLAGIIPRLERTGDGDGGFMTLEEKQSVEAEKGEPDKVSKIIAILRKKDNDAFTRFRYILRKSGNDTWDKELGEEVAKLKAASSRTVKKMNPLATNSDSDWQHALAELESELLASVSLGGVLPLLEKTSANKDGFMTRVERLSLRDDIDNSQKLRKIIQSLRKKDVHAFDSFCRILHKSGNSTLAETLRVRASRLQMSGVDPEGKDTRERGGYTLMSCN